MSQVDQKRAFNTLKHNLEPWRNVVMKMYSILMWEKNIYPAIIFATVSIGYSAFWMADFSVITFFSLAGFTAVISDYICPSLERLVHSTSTDEWSGKDEAQFEHVVSQIFNIRQTLIGWHMYLFTDIEKKSTMFVIVISVILLTLAWIGAIVNNMLLMYLLTLGVFLYPGVQNKGIIQQFKERFGCLVNSKMEKIREVTKKQE